MYNYRVIPFVCRYTSHGRCHIVQRAVRQTGSQTTTATRPVIAPSVTGMVGIVRGPPGMGGGEEGEGEEEEVDSRLSTP